jgi:ribosomal protein L19E
VIDGIKKTLGNYKDEELLDDRDFRKIYDKNNNAYYFRTWLKAEFTIESG